MIYASFSSFDTCFVQTYNSPKTRTNKENFPLSYQLPHDRCVPGEFNTLL